MIEKKKILMISDHPLSCSGVGTQSRYLISGLINTGKYSFRCLGAALKHESHDTVAVNSDFIIKPIDGFGSKDLIRMAIASERPNCLLLFTDPRFFLHIFEMEEEIHQICPIAYNHLWDQLEYPPIYNKVLYDSNDLLNCINRPTYDFLKNLYPEDRYPGRVNWAPHALPTEVFHPLSEQESLQQKRKLLPGKPDDEFVALWVSRNARRKRPADVLWSWRMFLDRLQATHGHQKATLVMHTDPLDQEGPNLFQNVDLMKLHNNVVFSKDRTDFVAMNNLYNVCDFVTTISCFPAGEFIVTEKGYKRIEEISVGEKVLTHKNRFKTVTKTLSRKLEKEKIFTIKSSNNQNIRVTGEHPLRVIKQSKINFLIKDNISTLPSLIEWIQAKDLAVGDLVVYDNLSTIQHQKTEIDLYDLVKDTITLNQGLYPQPRFSVDETTIYFGTVKTGRLVCNRYVKIDDDLAFILGLWVADGATHNTGICLNKAKERELASEYVTRVKRSLGAECNISENHGTRLPVWIRNGCVFAKMFTNLCGEYSHGKFVPDIVLNGSDTIKRAFLKGYLAGDGCLLKVKAGKDVSRIRTISHQLAFGIRTLLISLGECPKISWDRNDQGYSNGRIWCIEWREGRENNGSCRTWNVDRKMLVSRVFEINVEENQTCDVYNFSVEEDESYATAAMTVHNCAEGFGLSTLEGMYCGKPIIAIKTGGLERQVVDYRDGSENGIALNVDTKMMVGSQTVPWIVEDIVKNENIASAFLKMYEFGPEKRKQLGQKAMNYAHEEFGMKRLIETWDRTLEHTMATWRDTYKPWEMVKI